MPAGTVSISIWSNNPLLEENFLNKNLSAQLIFEKHKPSSDIPYLLILVDIDGDLSNISQKIINLYDQAKTKKQKIIVALNHSLKVDHEKIIYFNNLLDSLTGGNPLHRLVNIRDLYFTDLLATETPLSDYVYQSLVDRKIVISAKGDRLFYPLHILDLLEGLKRIFFLSSTAGKTFWLLGEPLKDLELAYLVKKYFSDSEGPEFEIDAHGQEMSADKDLTSLGNETKAQLNWTPVDNFPQDLKISVKKVSEDQSVLLSKLHDIHKPIRRSLVSKISIFLKNAIFSLKKKKGSLTQIESAPQLLRKIGEYVLVTILIIYLGFSVAFIGFTTASLVKLESTLGLIRKAQVQTSIQDLNQSIFFSRLGEASYAIVSPVISLVSPTLHAKNHNLFVFLNYSHSSLENVQQTYLLAEKIYSSIGTEVGEQFYLDSSLALRSNLGQIFENLNQLELLTGKNKLPKILEDRLGDSEEFKNLKLFEQQIVQILKAAELIPAFFSGNNVKNIVVLFQNSKEIRSTGGSINYIMAIAMQNGKLVSKNLYKPEELDPIVEGEVPSPPIIAKFTGSEDWNFRDLNYNPDFPQTATNISWLIEKALKFKPDIILGATDLLLSELIEGEKGIILNGQRITTESLNLELQNNTNAELYSQLINHYFDQILSHKLSLLVLGRVIATQSDNNHLLFWASDPQIEKTIIGQPYSGAIFPYTCHGGITSANCLTQTTYLNESNYSLIPFGNKLQRKVLHNIQLSSGLVRHQYRISYSFTENIPNSTKDLNLVYQLYAPLGSTLGQVNLDEKPVSLRGLFEQEDGGLKRFQFPVTMSLNQNHEVVIEFLTPVGLSFTPPFAYSITEYHQPGMQHSIEVNLEYPQSARPSVITAPVESAPNQIRTVLPAKNTTFGVGFVISE